MEPQNQEIDAVKQKLTEDRLKLEKDYDLVISKSFAEVQDTHIQKEFTFTVTEKRRLLQQESVALIIRRAIDDIINLSVLPRLNIQPHIDIKVLYDATLGRFTVFLPKDLPKEVKEEKTDASLTTEPTDKSSEETK